MSYFLKFPLLTYDMKGDKIRKLLPDILRDQDKKRQIQLLNKSVLGDFSAEFDRLITE